MTQPEVQSSLVGSFEPSVWCFLFVTLFNLQGTRRVRRNVTILANFISFVKHFFQKFFDARSVYRSSNFFSLPQAFRFVKHFFEKFLRKTFSLFRGNFLSLPHSLLFVNCFFDLVFQPARRAVSSATALIEYQIPYHLSIPFFDLFHFFNTRHSPGLSLCFSPENRVGKPWL